MNKLIYFLILTLTLSACVIGQKTKTIKFDKEKWKSSSNYRYSIINSKDFPILDYKSKRQVKRILGPPDFISNGEFVYCLDLFVKGGCKCQASLLTIGFVKDSPYNVTIVLVEPLPNE
ncbi:MAG TPA: hypothetical protein VK590_02915 [Saprospiraceae bacterium]|nr:hypothetical protein [Saprospiraceae bacterium]